MSAVTTNLRSKISKKEIRLHNIKPTENISSVSTGKVCLVCTTNISSYTCPQCYTPYCSSECYLKHSIECTEIFSRQRVKKILDYETIEKTQERDNFSNEETSNTQISYENYRDKNDISDKDETRVVTRMTSNSDQAEEEEEEGYTSEDDNIQSNINDPAHFSEGVNINNIDKIPSRVLSRLVKLWKPWWSSGDENKSIGILHSNSTSDKKIGISKVMTEIKMTCPRLNTLIQVDKLTRLVGYQILGLILGYVVAMHSVNGDWLNSTSKENSTDPDKNSTNPDEYSTNSSDLHTDLINEGSSENDKEMKQGEESEETEGTPDICGILDFINLICMSTPALNTAFRPASVMECIEAWLRYRPPSLQNISRKKIKGLLEDTLSILRYSEFLSFALLECWIAAYSCQCLNVKGDVSSEKNEINRCLKSLSNNLDGFVDSTLPLMDYYGDIFRKPTPPIRGQKSRVYREDQAEKIAADLLGRKSFFLLLYVLDDNRIEVLKELSVELNEYVSTYFD